MKLLDYLKANDYEPFIVDDSAGVAVGSTELCPWCGGEDCFEFRGEAWECKRSRARGYLKRILQLKGDLPPSGAGWVDGGNAHAELKISNDEADAVRTTKGLWEVGYYADRISDIKRSRLSWGWEELDDLTRGFRFGEYTVVSGFTGEGKTSWCADFIRHQAHQGAAEHYGVGVITLENTPEEFVRTIVGQEARQNFEDLSDDARFAVIDRLSALPLRILDHSGYFPQSKLLGMISYMAKTGYRVILIDHSGYTINPSTKDRLQMDSMRMSKIMASIAKETKVHIVLVHHTTKGVDKPKDGKPASPPQLHDLKDSAAWAQEANNVIVVSALQTANRDAEWEIDPIWGRAKIVLLKVRSVGARKGSIALAFHKPSARFQNHREIAPDQEQYP